MIGSRWSAADDRKRTQVGKTGRIVLDLVHGLENANHHCYMDKPAFIHFVEKQGMFTIGIARVRAGFPDAELEAVHLTEPGHCTWGILRELYSRSSMESKKGIFCRVKFIRALKKFPLHVPIPGTLLLKMKDLSIAASNNMLEHRNKRKLHAWAF